MRFDSIGVGMSDRDIKRYDFDEKAEDLRIAVDAAGLDRFILYSESGGVHAALRFAANHPDRVSRLAILGGYVDGRSRRAVAPHPDFLRSPMEEHWDNVNAGLLRAFAPTYFSDGPIEEAMSHARVYQAATDRHFQLMARDAINTVSSAEFLTGIRCPTLIVHGRGDAVHPLSEAQKLAAGIDGAELLVLETSNHLPWPGHKS